MGSITDPLNCYATEKWLFVAIIFLIIMLWSISWSLSIYYFKNWQDRGTFGDMFGAINSLFSGLAFAGVIFTIYLQKRELEFQRKELELTREQVERSASAQEKSEEALKQQVEALYLTAKLNSLNALITLCNERIDEIKDPDPLPASYNENMRQEHEARKQSAKRIRGDIIRDRYVFEGQLRETLERIKSKTE